MSATPARARVTSPERVEKYRTERESILRAAYDLVGSADGEAVTVADILAAVGLSTRAFYRHFRSKDELILTMYRTASERVSEELSRAIVEAADPAAALEAWIRHHLSVVYEARRARQASVLTSTEVRATPGIEQAIHEDARVRRMMLAEVLRAGSRQGVFTAVTDPDEDARAIGSVVMGLIDARLAGQPTPGWAEATEHTTALFRRALGVGSAVE